MFQEIKYKVVTEALYCVVLKIHCSIFLQLPFLLCFLKAFNQWLVIWNVFSVCLQFHINNSE